MELVDFIRARLDEDEQTARHATDGPWVDPLGGPIRGGYEERFVIAQQAQRWNSQHIARHDPARVLAEVEAKRQILRLHSCAEGHECSTLDHNGEIDHCTWVMDSEACTTLRLLALPYADHEAYREEWRP